MVEAGVDALAASIEALIARHEPLAGQPAAQDACWRSLVAGPLASAPFDEHWRAWQRVFATRRDAEVPPAAYKATAARLARAHVTALAARVGVQDYTALHAWSVRERGAFWAEVIADLKVPFATPPKTILPDDADARSPDWLRGAQFNIARACFTAPDDAVAIVLGREDDASLTQIRYRELRAQVERAAHAFRGLGLKPGDAVALYLPMNLECVVAYLGLVLAGLPVVSIADSFAPAEVAMRLKLANARAIVTTAAFERAGKTHDLYEKARQAEAPQAIIVGAAASAASLARSGDVRWDEIMAAAPESAFTPHVASPQDVTNILFSSGTTGEPKAIPWTHLTPIKAAMDGRYHLDIHDDDVVCWPTSIGWMMGPWLVYASLVNGATMALYEGAPNSAGFARFVEQAGVTTLGLVPSLARAWRRAGACEDADWSGIRTFSSTGEASNAEDYLWLMHLARYQAPVIEYCGGTEIGGGHLTGSVVQAQSPATFSTPALGLDVVILDDQGGPAAAGAMGEIYLLPPSIGLSQRLLNRDHHKEYYDGTPRGPAGALLRRHGDEVQRLGGGYYQAHGRADDTMNLGGIKVSSLELERVMDADPATYQTAAVATTPPAGGAERLVVFCVPTPSKGQADAAALKVALQARIKTQLNPLFRIHDIVIVATLPRTASNKIMRRELRAQYQSRDAA